MTSGADKLVTACLKTACLLLLLSHFSDVRSKRCKFLETHLNQILHVPKVCSICILLLDRSFDAAKYAVCNKWLVHENHKPCKSKKEIKNKKMVRTATSLRAQTLHS